MSGEVSFDRKVFFREIRLSVFRGRLSRKQVQGMNHLLAAWEQRYAAHLDVRMLAYCLATAWHETAHTMLPIRETLARSDRQAIARLRKWARKLSPRRRKKVLAYARVHPDTGKAYFGRGYVQLTWRRNYREMGKLVGLDLERRPELALRPEVAARILYSGMINGLFTGRALDEFINDDICDFVSARRVVNGTDKAHLIAGAAEEFLSALTAAQIMVRRQVDVAEAEREARAPASEPAANPQPAPPPEVMAGRTVPQTGKPPARSTTVWAAIAALLAQGVVAVGAVSPAVMWMLLGGGMLAALWVVRERIRHAWEDGV